MTVKKITPVRVNPVLVHPEEKRFNLNGQWKFRLDPDDRGVEEQWFDDTGILVDRISVPGCWQGQGFGSDDRDVVWDFKLEARTFRATCTGTGWYGKHFEVPVEWKGMYIWLNFGGVHPSVEVWLNGVYLGENDVPFVPFGFDITEVIRFDGENYLVVRVHDVADEVGLLVQSEMGMLGAWGSHTQWHGYAWPQPTPGYREALKRQWDLVVARDANHPSANIYCMSNELTDTLFPRLAWQCYHDTKAIKPTAFVIWTDGGWNGDLPGDFVNAEADKDETCSKPLIQHEFRWWSSFPDVRIIHKYSRAIRPYAAEIAIEAAARHGISHVLPLAAANSQRLQFLEAKGKMEMCRRDHPTLAGICHFNAMDTNPSPQGIIDEFYERKYTDSATWRETNGEY